MQCPKCQNMDTRVIDSRNVESGQTIRRRRECEFCKHRFTTFERKGFTELMVVKRDGTKELYDKQKVKKALMLAFAKREITTEQIENIINNLELQWSSEHNEIPAKQIGEDILGVLKEVDTVAYLRFASVYKSFESLEDFKKLME